MADVGKVAGVSVCTVSRAFNTPDTVRPAIRERIFAAADKLKYTPNSAAKALRLQNTHIFGVVIPTLDHAFFAKLVNNFQEATAPSGYMVVVLTTGFDNSVMSAKVQALVERGAEGLMVVGRVDDADLRKYLEKVGIPVVATYSYLEGDKIPSIGFDNYAAARQSIDYLTRLGHRELAMIAASTKGNDRQEARVRAFHDAWTELGLKKPWPVVQREYVNALSEGAESLRHIRTIYPETTAVVCNSDAFALGALMEARRMGIDVPGEVSIVGHDDHEMASLIQPGLTTVAVPAAEMGRRAAEALLNAKKHNAPILPMKLDANLIIRASTGRPRDT